ncbi:hypothetical protein P43SY_008484 [Pythium insidiosum]|uniref:Uncharacterized protein n=1 Tax=Pythium insidiosum TaxID=114742 RepID=A0AAD5QCX2_PYTIN|nr:hypothetical protein P43SY_008484 [Pythium insidiosum]
MQLVLALTAALAAVAQAQPSGDWRDLPVDITSAAVLYRALHRAEQYAPGVDTYACASRIDSAKTRGWPEAEFVFEAELCRLQAPNGKGFCFGSDCASGVKTHATLYVRGNDQGGSETVTRIDWQQ